jgi:hypothetical protein
MSCVVQPLRWAVLYGSIIFPLFDSDTGVFLTVEGQGCVLTHECDVDQNNNKLFNTDVLICPIIPLQDVVEELAQELTQVQLISFLTNLGARNISRLVYLPTLASSLKYGGVLYLNQITNTPANLFHNGYAHSIGALTGYGLTVVDYSIENHLLRPKADHLAGMPPDFQTRN